MNLKRGPLAEQPAAVAWPRRLLIEPFLTIRLGSMSSKVPRFYIQNAIYVEAFPESL
jgi:hypothetical protein